MPDLEPVAPSPYEGMKTRAQVEEALANVRTKLEEQIDAPVEKLRRYQAEVQVFKWILGELGESPRIGK